MPKQIAPFILLVLIAGCDQGSTTTATKLTEEAVPVAVLRHIPERVKLIKVGMSKEEALKTLGLAGYALVGMCDGPREHYNYSYYFRTNCLLVLGMDMSQTPPTVTIVRGGFAPAVAMGEGWAQIKK